MSDQNNAPERIWLDYDFATQDLDSVRVSRETGVFTGKFTDIEYVRADIHEAEVLQIKRNCVHNSVFAAVANDLQEAMCRLKIYNEKYGSD